VFAGNLFPFLFITIACGAVSGFHSLVASGTTPKMIGSEGDLPLIGYGAMLMESFVAIMALIAACVLDPAIYFALNSPAALIGTTTAEAASAISGWGFTVTPAMLDQVAAQVGETTILSRTGGAPTLATAIAVGGWGWFLYQGVTDPLGGINTLWPLFGISNQMLAAMALTLCTVVLFRMKRERFAWVTLIPLGWLLTCTLTASWQKMFHTDWRIGFLAHAERYSEALSRGETLAPANSIAQMRQVIFNDYVNASLCALFVAVVLAIAYYGVRAIADARRTTVPTAREVAGAVA
jgi:carbon starvation protein CstA